MDEVIADFRKALAEAEKRGAVYHKSERNETELDMAVNRYKEEKQKQERLARFCI